jgi:hypothetical protein
MTRPTSVVDNRHLRVDAYFLAGFEACRLLELLLAITLFRLLATSFLEPPEYIIYSRLYKKNKSVNKKRLSPAQVKYYLKIISKRSNRLFNELLLSPSQE